MDCCSITELRNKEVISSKNGCRIGYVSDVEISTNDGRLTAIIIWGKNRFGGMFGREEDIRICWENIKVIGDDTILVECDIPGRPPRQPGKKGVFDGLFRY